MEISRNFGIVGTDGVRSSANLGKASAGSATAKTASTARADILDLSSEAQELDSAPAASNGIRTEKVAELRRAIAEGNYDTDDKVSAALDNFLNQLG
jgi:negative regulator of flagellin synthesis FlgM